MLDNIMQLGRPNVIGRLGENEHRRMLFDISEELKSNPDATFTLLNQIPGSATAYPVQDVETDNQYLYWTVTDSDLTADGMGQCEIVLYDGEEIGKSVFYSTNVLPALDGAGTAPDPWESWLQQFTQLRDETVAAEQRAAQYALEITVSNGTIHIDKVTSINDGEEVGING